MSGNDCWNREKLVLREKVSEWVGFNVPLNIYFGDESFLADSCTGTDKQKQNTAYTRNIKKQTQKPTLTNKTNLSPGLVW